VDCTVEWAGITAESGTEPDELDGRDFNAITQLCDAPLRGHAAESSCNQVLPTCLHRLRRTMIKLSSSPGSRFQVSVGLLAFPFHFLYTLMSAVTAKQGFNLREFLFNRKHQRGFIETIRNVGIGNPIFK
jgi:hypothetical protein